MEQDRERYTRGGVLVVISGLAALVVGAPAALYGIASALGGRAMRQRAIDLGPLAAYPEGRFVIATFLTDPAQGEVSRRAAYVRCNGAESFTILSSRCTHVGCPTQPNGPIQTDRLRVEATEAGPVGLTPTEPAGFGCPCHGSQFDTEGNRTAGPAVRALDRWQYSIVDGRLMLGTPYSVDHVDGSGARARIRAYPLKPPGQPVSGPASLLYPAS
jgi:Rieske Fe-S protein